MFAHWADFIIFFFNLFQYNCLYIYLINNDIYPGVAVVEYLLGELIRGIWRIILVVSGLNFDPGIELSYLKYYLMYLTQFLT